MNVYISKFEKVEECDDQLNTRVTKLSLSIHPVLELSDTEARINPVGIEPTIVIQGKATDHTNIVTSLRDIADMIEGALEGKTAEEFVKELGTCPEGSECGESDES